jgi:hypothetical protein
MSNLGKCLQSPHEHYSNHRTLNHDTDLGLYHCYSHLRVHFVRSTLYMIQRLYRSLQQDYRCYHISHFLLKTVWDYLSLNTFHRFSYT